MKALKPGLIAIVIGAVIWGAAATVASACLLTSLVLTPNTGPAGTHVLAESSGDMPGRSYRLTWDGTEIATGVTDGDGNGSVTFDVPLDAAEGDHTVVYEYNFEYRCSDTFTVTANVVSDAYVGGVASVSTRTGTGAATLPRTGFSLEIPVIGLITFAVAGALLIRRPRRG